MKQIILVLIYFLPLLVLAQDKKNFSEEDIRKDKDYIALQSQIKPVEEKMAAIMNEYQQAPASKQNDLVFQKAIEKRYSDAINEVTTILLTFVSKHPNSYISLLALSELVNSNAGIDMSKLESSFNGLSATLKKTEFGEAIGNQIFAKTRTVIGSVAPDFSQNNPDGKPIKLSDFRGKYVLIDFWASWCTPCRQENPNVVKAYAQFKNKNFEILGVSLDNPNAKTAWLNAIEKDKLTWPQVSDLQGWKNQAARLYGVESIPQNFLIDPKGVIVAKNLRGEELIRTLSNILK